MSYVKTNWQNDQAPAINATNLNKIENGIFNNDAIITSIMTTLGINATTWVSTNTYVEGDTVVYNNKIYKNITGNYTTTNPATDTTNWQETTMLDIQYPIGKTEIFYDTLDHSNYMGFTWERTAVGKAITGYDSNDSLFDTIGETGGSPTHTLSLDEIPGNVISTTTTGSNSDGYIMRGGYSPNGTYNVGGSGYAHSIMQPYQVFAIWKRVS